MTEKKTFKGAVWLATNAHTWYVECPIAGNPDPMSEYPRDEWDMEVTFTKKVKPEVGGTATLENYATIFTIIAISDERVWLQDPNNQAQNFVRRFDQLRNVEPWRPA